MSKRHARMVTRHKNPSKPRWRKEGRELQRQLVAAKDEAARLRVSLDGVSRDYAAAQELFEALRDNTRIEGNTGEEIVAGVVNELATLRAEWANRSPIVSANEAEESRAATTAQVPEGTKPEANEVGVPEGRAKGGQGGETSTPEFEEFPARSSL